jgi:hypothetical protein
MGLSRCPDPDLVLQEIPVSRAELEQSIPAGDRLLIRRWDDRDRRRHMRTKHAGQLNVHRRLKLALAEVRVHGPNLSAPAAQETTPLNGSDSTAANCPFNRTHARYCLLLCRAQRLGRSLPRIAKPPARWRVQAKPAIVSHRCRDRVPSSSYIVRRPWPAAPPT